MQLALQNYAATVASAALRHDFGVPLTLIGRNATFLEELVADKALKFRSSSEKLRLVDLCRQASRDSSSVHELMRAFGREIKFKRGVYPQSQRNFDIQKRYFDLNDKVGPVVSSLTNTSSLIYRIISERFSDDPTITKLVLRMNQSATRVQEMYSGLTHFFRINEIDESTYSLRKIDLTIASVAKSVRLSNINPNLRDIRISGAASGEIIESQFVLIFQNLLQNAAKFTLNRSDPNIEVSIREKRFIELQKIYPEHLRKYGARGDWIEVNTIDNGVGVDSKFSDRIFDIYFTRDSANITAGGTGMGLAIAKLVATIHRGVLFVKSNMNPTAFCLAIPQRPGDGISLTSLTQLEHALSQP
jgi:signal transduction histidine kinase